MAKQKRKHTPQLAKSAQKSGTAASVQGDVVTGPAYPSEEIKWWREAVEGLVVAIILALLIRGFEAEAFVIPTGSMAPTLRGQHKDVRCEQCQNEYACGASLESETQHGRVVLTMCPMCGFPQDIPYEKARDASFTGDRILVNKFSYDPLGKPERFDVIVFKNPNDAKQNYIKRLCGLPGETVRLFRGDIWVNRHDSGNKKYTIARKPPKKLRAMLQPVHDTKFNAPVLTELGLPPRWQAAEGSAAWSSEDAGKTFSIAESPNTNWIRYRHIVPDLAEWGEIRAGRQPNFQGTRGELITDFYAYNSYLNAGADPGDPRNAGDPNMARFRTFGFYDRSTGKNWVGDLGVECDVEIESDTGEFALDLVEGGWHFQCSFDIATGAATLSVTDPTGNSRPMKAAATVTGPTSVKGAGSYRMLFTNVDSELRLWVDDKVVDFGGQATTYGRAQAEEEELRPFYGGPENPGDLAPIGVGGKNVKANVTRLRVHRDKYYVAVKGGVRTDPTKGDYRRELESEDAHKLFREPERWATTDLFYPMPHADFDLQDFEDDSKDQFFPMGDNSPQSHDARVWTTDTNYVERQFLIGEAVLIYYPHPWHAKLPGKEFRSVPLIFYPKFSRMGIIR